MKCATFSSNETVKLSDHVHINSSAKIQNEYPLVAKLVSKFLNWFGEEQNH